jgi:hypothetical protein
LAVRSRTKDAIMKTPKKKPGSPLDAIYRRTDLNPEQMFQALQRLRLQAMEQIEYLIDLCNEMDGDVDLEPEPAESNLAGFQNCSEQQDDGEADDADDEPSLGSIEDHPNGCVTRRRRSQEQWATGGTLDLEEQHDGREPSEEDEGGQCDDEGAEPDSGIGDFDGLMEQWHGYAGSGASGFARYVA